MEEYQRDLHLSDGDRDERRRQRPTSDRTQSGDVECSWSHQAAHPATSLSVNATASQTQQHRQMERQTASSSLSPSSHLFDPRRSPTAENIRLHQKQCLRQQNGSLFPPLATIGTITGASHGSPIRRQARDGADYHSLPQEAALALSPHEKLLQHEQQHLLLVNDAYWGSPSEVAAAGPSPLFKGQEIREKERSSNAPLEKSFVPTFIQFNSSSVGQKIPRESQPRQPARDRTSDESSLGKPPGVELLLQLLTSDEKDRLLRRLLLSQQRQDRSTRKRDQNVAMSKATHTHQSTIEKDALNVQAGIMNSLKKVEAEEEALKNMSQNVDEEALKFGIEASKLDFRERCRYEDEIDQALLERARMASIAEYSARQQMSNEERCVLLELEAKFESLSACPVKSCLSDEEEDRKKVKRKSLAGLKSPHEGEDHIVEQTRQESLYRPIAPTLYNYKAEEECLVKEANIPSLASASKSDLCTSGSDLDNDEEDRLLIERVKRESSAYPRPMTQEERLMDEVKRDSLVDNVPFFAQCNRDASNQGHSCSNSSGHLRHPSRPASSFLRQEGLALEDPMADVFHLPIDEIHAHGGQVVPPTNYDGSRYGTGLDRSQRGTIALEGARGGFFSLPLESETSGSPVPLPNPQAEANHDRMWNSVREDHDPREREAGW